MSKIINRTTSSIENFTTNVYGNQKKHILFWDTCALLDILRFLFRGGDSDTYRKLNSINMLIQRDEVYSLASNLTIIEWNDHVDEVVKFLDDSLNQTSIYHKNVIETINEINTTTFQSESLFDKRLQDDLMNLAESILSKTIFLESDDVAQKALTRVSLRKPPASKKNEFKDCVIWETMSLVCENIQRTKLVDDNFNFLFYTVNTDDFIDKSREPRIFHGALLTEASIVNMVCCQNTDEVCSRL